MLYRARVVLIVEARGADRGKLVSGLSSKLRPRDTDVNEGVYRGGKVLRCAVIYIYNSSQRNC